MCISPVAQDDDPVSRKDKLERFLRPQHPSRVLRISRNDRRLVSPLNLWSRFSHARRDLLCANDVESY